MRLAFAMAGVAALGWGGWLAFEFATGGRDVVQVLFWLVGGPLLHDAVVAPVVGALGLVLVRSVPVVWLARVAVGAVLSGVLVLLAVPLLWRPFGVPRNPGLHDGDYVLGLGVALAVVWAGVLVSGLATARRGDGPRSRCQPGRARPSRGRHGTDVP